MTRRPDPRESDPASAAHSGMDDVIVDLTTSGPSRRDVLRSAGVLGAAGAIAATLGACGGGPQSTNQTGGGKGGSSLTAVIGYGNNQSWDPSQTASAFSLAAFLHVYEPLVGGDPVTRAPYAALAKTLPNTSGTSFNVTLRDGATWHDGKPVTADDVVFTFERALDPSANVEIRAFFSQWLSKVTQVDDHTVKFQLKSAFPYVLSRLQTAKILPRHVYDGKWDVAKAGTTVVGSGPYKVTAQSPLSSTSFAKHDGYNGPRPAVYDTMLWKSIVDASARVATVSGKTPQAQIAENIPGQNAATLKTAGRTVQYADGMNMLFLMFNTAHKPFDDKRVRQALHYAVNREQLINTALAGYGTQGQNWINPKLGIAGATTASTPTYSYNPTKAKQLLAAAGATGLKITLQCSNTSVVANSIAVIKANWEAIGVSTTLASQDTAALFSKLDGGLDYQVVTTTGNSLQFASDPDLLTRFYYSADGLWTKKYARWSGAEASRFYALQDKTAVETDATKRASMEKQLLDLLAEEAVIFPLVFGQMGTAWDATKITGVRAQGYPGINLLQAKKV